MRKAFIKDGVTATYSMERKDGMRSVHAITIDSSSFMSPSQLADMICARHGVKWHNLGSESGSFYYKGKPKHTFIVDWSIVISQVHT